MKARDLAALAALGIAGKYAFDKFGNKKKDDEPKSKGKKQAEQEAYDYDTPAQKAELGTKGAYLPETAELRTKGAYLDDTPEFRTKGAYLDERATPAVEAKPVAKPVAKAAVSRSVAAAPAAAAAAAPAAAPIASTVQDSAQMPDATRVKAYNPDIMYNKTIPADTRPAMGSMNHLAYKRNQRAGVVPSQRPNDAAAARIARQSASASEIAARQAEIARKEKAFQARVAFDPARASSIPLEHSQNVSFAKQYQRGRAKGGAVKMASGGMTSSKMSSKPSAASSRGDGIAQRGKTRGMIR